MFKEINPKRNIFKRSIVPSSLQTSQKAIFPSPYRMSRHEENETNKELAVDIFIWKTSLCKSHRFAE